VSFSGPGSPAAVRDEQVVAAGGDRSVLMVGNFTLADQTYRHVCDELAERLGNSGWEVHTTSARVAKVPRLAEMVATVWRRRHDFSAAYVEVFSGPAFFWAEAVCWALRRTRKPYVLALHGGNLPAFSERWPGRVGRLLGSARAVTAPSRYLREGLRRFREDIQVIPNPLDIAAYGFRPREPLRPRIVWLRAFSSIYNPSLAIRVLAHLAVEFPDARLTMIGPDKRDGSLDQTRRVAAELGVLDRVDWTGGVPKSDVPSRLGAGDLFLNTSNVDNTPVSVLEAMACGMCVVSTNVGGVPFLLQHEVDSLLVPPDDSEAMVGAVRRVLTEPGLAARLSSNARRKAESFDWSVVLPRWDSLMVQLVSLGGSPAHVAAKTPNARKGQ
jgi:glycosyltransferase involved in cell wall biosynthesis